MRKSANYNKSGVSVILVLIIVALVIILSGAFLLNNRNKVNAPQSALGSLPPENERVNPQPQSGNFLQVDDVDPGISVIVNQVVMQDGGYIAVQRESSGSRITLGKSDLLEAGSHDNITIATSALSDGDAVYIVLLNSSGTAVVDENENAIEVLKNVGMLSGHEMGHDEGNSYY